MTVMPIPDDWDGISYCHYLLCWPDSPSYAAILLGQVTAIQRGRFWDDRTGEVTLQQEISNGIIKANTDSLGVVMGCNDIIDQLAAISAALQNIDNAQINIALSSESNAQSSLELNQNVIAMSAAISVSQAWSESMAVATASVEVSNNVSLAIGSVSPAQPPPVSMQEPTGISNIPRGADRYCDVAEYIVDSTIYFWKAFQDFTVGVTDFTLSTLLGLVSESSYSVGLLGLPEWIMPASTTAAVASGLLTWVLEKTLQVNTAQSLAILEDNRTALICYIYEAATSGMETADIRRGVSDQLTAFGATEALLRVILPALNPALFALIYFDSPLVSVPVGTFDCTLCAPS